MILLGSLIEVFNELRNVVVVVFSSISSLLTSAFDSKINFTIKGNYLEGRKYLAAEGQIA